MRWDIIGVAGVAVGLLGVAVTIFIHEEQKRVAEEQRVLQVCADLRSAVSAADILVDAAKIKKREIQNNIKYLSGKVENSNQRVENARSYFEALDGEILADKVWNQFDRAGKIYDENGGDWEGALEEAGYPSDWAERRLIARQLWRFDLESGYDNALVFGGWGRELPDLLNELKRVSENAARERDRFFRSEFQGTLDRDFLLQGLRDENGRAINAKNAVSRELSGVNVELRAVEKSQREAERQLTNADCEID